MMRGSDAGDSHISECISVMNRSSRPSLLTEKTLAADGALVASSTVCVTSEKDAVVVVVVQMAGG